MSIVKSYSFPEGDIRGDMFYIKHGSRNFTVIDCYLKDGDGNNARKDEIIKEIKNESAGRVCRFISTHPDNDHIAGIEYLDDSWEITNFYAVDNNRPTDDNDDSLTRYHWLLANKNFAIKRGIRRAWLNETNDENGCSGINFMWPDLENEKFKQALKLVSEGKEVNNICPIFTYSIENGATYMWMGDLETEMQQAYYDEYKNNIPQVEILGMCENEDLYSMKTRVYTTYECKTAYLKKFGKTGTYDLNASGVITRNGIQEKVYQRILIINRKFAPNS